MVDETDYEYTKNLPTHFVPFSNPKSTILKLLDRRKEAHENLIKSMKEQLTKINLKIDKVIKENAEEMKKELKLIKYEVKEYFITIKFKVQNLDLEDDYFKKTNKQLTRFHHRQLEAVTNFCNYLHIHEATRSQEFKELLKETKLKAIEIVHELPFMLDEYFELAILEMNKMTLSNYQHYGELEEELKLQIKNDFKGWLEELIETKEKLKDKLKSMTKKSALFADDLSRDESFRSDDLQDELRRYNILKSEFQIEMFGEGSAPVSQLEIEKWLKEVQKCLGALDQSAKNIVKLYKSTITVLFHRYLGELDEIKRNLETGVVHTNQIETYQCEIYTPTADQLNIECLDDLRQYQNLWSASIEEMTDNINETFTFLKGAAFQWDRHFDRVQDLQMCILRDLENTIKKNASSSDCFEANLNIVLEELRQGSNIKELDKCLEKVKNYLDKMEETYHTDASCEVNVVLKYKTMMDTEIDVLITELKRYLTVHPQDYEKDPKKQRKRASQISFREEGTALPIQILYCVFQVGAVRNWMFGLWEAIEQYVAVCRTEIMEQVDLWIDGQCDKIHQRLEMKLIFHDPRFEHVKCANYDKRLRELRLHIEQYESHRIAAETRKTELEVRQFDYEKQCEEICNKFIEECEKLSVTLLETTSSYQANCYTVTVRDKLNSTTESLKKVTANYIDDCTIFFEEVKMSNYLFLKNIKLFAEGGNFNLEEANILYRDLIRLQETISRDVDAVIKEINTRFWRHSSNVQNAETSITTRIAQIVGEHTHNEKLVKKINKLQRDLREHVLSLKKIFFAIEKKLQRMIAEARNNIGKEEYLNKLLSQYETFIEEIIEAAEYVYHSEPVDIFSLTNNKLLFSKNTNYVDILFNKLPDSEKTDFMTMSIKLLYDSYLNILDAATEFYYQSHGNLLLDSSKLQPTLEDCMNEVLRKYRPYLIQCEICWLENSAVFISVLNKIKLFKEEFAMACESAFYKECMKKFDLSIKVVVEELNETEKEFNERLNQIYNRLKVLFGNPKNNQMLKDLQKDYDELHEDHQMKFSSIIEPKKEFLDKAFEDTTLELDRIKSILQILIDNHKVSEIIEKLNLQITTKRQLLSVVVFEINDTDKIPLDRSIIEHMQTIFHGTSTTLEMSDSHSQLKATSLATISTENSFSSIEDFLNVLLDCLHKAKANIEEFVNQKLLQSLEDFKNSWSSDIDYILSLYKVRYDIF